MPTTFKTATSSSGGFLQCYIELPYSKLVEKFGEPTESDGYKVSTEWCIESDDGFTFQIYDWKETSLYDEDYPSVAEFRALPIYSWHIGASSTPSEELLQSLKEFVMSEPEIEVETLSKNNIPYQPTIGNH